MDSSLFNRRLGFYIDDEKRTNEFDLVTYWLTKTKGRSLWVSFFVLLRSRRDRPIQNAKRFEYGFAYPTRRSKSLLFRRRVWVYSSVMKFPYSALQYFGSPTTESRTEVLLFLFQSLATRMSRTHSRTQSQAFHSYELLILQLITCANRVRNIAPPLPRRKPCRAEQIPVWVYSSVMKFLYKNRRILLR